jgi:hypothetical protein
MYVGLAKEKKGGANVKVYAREGGVSRLIGRAEIDDDGGSTFRVQLFGATSAIIEDFAIEEVRREASAEAHPIVERCIFVAPGQHPEFLPRWQPLTS